MNIKNNKSLSIEPWGTLECIWSIWKLFVLNKNTWNHIIVQIICIKHTYLKL